MQLGHGWALLNIYFTLSWRYIFHLLVTQNPICIVVEGTMVEGIFDKWLHLLNIHNSYQDRFDLRKMRLQTHFQNTCSRIHLNIPSILVKGSTLIMVIMISGRNLQVKSRKHGVLPPWVPWGRWQGNNATSKSDVSGIKLIHRRT